MIKYNFTLTQNIILSLILFNILAVSAIPKIVFSELYVYLIQIFVFLFFLIFDENSGKFIKFKFKKFSIQYVDSIIIILTFFISSFYYNINNNLGAVALIKLSTYPIVIYLFFIYIPSTIYQNPSLFEKLLNYWIVFAMFSVFVSFILLLSGVTIYQKSEAVTIGYFYYSNIFAFIFTFTIPILIYKYFTRQINLIVYLLCLFSSSIILLFTFSRAGYLGVLASVFILIYKRSKAVFVAVVLFILLVSSTFVLDFAKAKGSMSAITRVQVMYIGYDMIVNNGPTKLLWGYGIFNSKKEFVNQLASTFQMTREETGPHNFILTLGIQFGLIFTFSILLLIFIILLKSYIKSNKKILNYTKVHLAISIVIGICIECLMEDILIYPEFFVMSLFLIFLGYLNCYNYDKCLAINEKTS